MRMLHVADNAKADVTIFESVETWLSSNNCGKDVSAAVVEEN